MGLPCPPPRSGTSWPLPGADQWVTLALVQKPRPPMEAATLATEPSSRVSEWHLKERVGQTSTMLSSHMAGDQSHTQVLRCEATLLVEPVREDAELVTACLYNTAPDCFLMFHNLINLKLIVRIDFKPKQSMTLDCQNQLSFFLFISPLPLLTLLCFLSLSLPRWPGDGKSICHRASRLSCVLLLSDI